MYLTSYHILTRMQFLKWPGISSWCFGTAIVHRCCEFPSRTTCSQGAVLSLSSPNRVDTRQVGRPKFHIKEVTLNELRSLDFSWEDISRMLLVSGWCLAHGVKVLPYPPVPFQWHHWWAIEPQSAKGCLAQLPSMLGLKVLSPNVSWHYEGLHVQGIYKPALAVYVTPQISNDPKPLKFRLSSHVHSEMHWLCGPIDPYHATAILNLKQGWTGINSVLKINYAF